MRKLFFLLLLAYDTLFSQNIVLQSFTSQSNEPQIGLTNTAYRHVGDSIKRFVQVRISSGNISSLTINATIEPELMFQNLIKPDSTPTTFIQTASGYQITLSGSLLDSMISNQGPNNHNGQLDSLEILEISERSRVISCSVGDQNNASNQSLYTLSGSISGNTQANTIIV